MDSTHDLLARWDAWGDRQLWRKALANRGKPEHKALAERKLAELESATGLDALAANAELVKLLKGWQWLAIKSAREDGATWEQVGEVLGISKQGALNDYTRAIEAQEKYAPDFHDAAAARAVLAGAELEEAEAAIYEPDDFVQDRRADLDLNEDDYKALNRWAGSAAIAVNPDHPRLSLAQALRAMIRATTADEVVTAVVLDLLRREQEGADR